MRTLEEIILMVLINPVSFKTKNSNTKYFILIIHLRFYMNLYHRILFIIIFIMQII